MEQRRKPRDRYRPNVAILILNSIGQVLWCQRASGDGWQVPQGGVEGQETTEQTLERELYEEVGLTMEDVQILGHTRRWYRYKLPVTHPRPEKINAAFTGQKQRWYLLRLKRDDSPIVFNRTSENVEFKAHTWVNYWYPIHAVVAFKRQVYRRAFLELKDKAFGFHNP